VQLAESLVAAFVKDFAETLGAVCSHEYLEAGIGSRHFTFNPFQSFNRCASFKSFKNSKRPGCSSNRTRTGRQNLMSGHKGRDRLLPRNRRERVKKVIETMSALEEVEKVSERYTCAHKYLRPA
jgi:hypothetical protein